ncbi:Phosphate transport system permease protein PstA [Posidoniimonas polymericola]|uniref:Phosphate transport system permease protein PstA n=1 Tax=Posidoniimonas polymericola TaxID=2528002 RepID=A0A5C5YRU5_9BACT|nr:phosphate ABC transporter permease PstA [Posidoniimonas polymericola]TWT77619.1 Phosphate transport system permease protein PstA [Posidoniimonas polymericola]
MTSPLASPEDDALLRRRQWTSRVFGLLCGGATLLCLAILFGLLATVAVNAYDAFLPAETRAALEGKSTLEGLGTRVGALFSAEYWQRGWRFLAEGPSRRPADAGVNPAIFGSLWLIGLTALLSVPAGVGAAVYLEEYAAATRWKRLVQLNIANLAGVPSIVYGILGLGVFVRAVSLQAPGGEFLVGLSLGRVILSGALTLSLVVLPIVILASQEALRAVPKSIRQASYALGATKWQTTWRQVLPAALPGMMTGVILAISRALGEAAPLVAVGAVGFISYTPKSAYSEFTALPLQIYNWASRPQAEFHALASAAILVLLAVLIMMNAVAVWVRYYYGQRIRW